MTAKNLRGFMHPVILLIFLILLGSCGREAPVFQPGHILVTSTPEGAAIFLDGVDTGQVTPDTLQNLDVFSLGGQTYFVSLVMEGFFVSPDVQTAVVMPYQITELPEFTLSPTSLVVTSNPEGANIYLDGELQYLDDEQQELAITPATIVGVPAGTIEVSLSLDNYLISPASFTANVIPGQANEIPEDTFILRPRHTVLFESFSNVSCQGCPEMAINLEEVTHRPEYGLDRVLYLKYSMQWPSNSDPHYVYNMSENDARMNYYLNDVISGIPVLNMLGNKVTGTSANSTPDADEIAALLEGGALAIDPGFLIDVSADFSSTDIPVTVTLTAVQDVDLTGKTLFVALVQTLLEYDVAPGSEGETEFHNLFRDRADTVDDLTNLTAGTTQIVNTTLVRDDWDLSTMLAIAFVQDDSDHSILQAGSTALPEAAAAPHFFNFDNNHRKITSGRE